MSTGYPEQINFPPIDPDAITPTVDDVALLIATRTIDEGGTQLVHFTSDTVPTDVQVQGLIAQATTLVLGALPNYLSSSLYGRIKEAVAIQAAILVETSFYREQANAGSIVELNALLRTALNQLEEDSGGGTGTSSRVDSIVVRSTMTDYDPYYPMPPPPAVGIEWPDDDDVVVFDGGGPDADATMMLHGGAPDTDDYTTGADGGAQ